MKKIHRKLTFSHLKMDGWNTIVSFWDGLFSGDMLVLGRVIPKNNCRSISFNPLNGSDIPWNPGWFMTGFLFHPSWKLAVCFFFVCFWFYLKYPFVTLLGTNISHLWKRKLIFAGTFKGDMLLPWRAIFSGPMSGAPSIKTRLDLWMDGMDC